MEFEERRKTSQRVQFWLLVQGLKDPLEEHFASTRTDSTETYSQVDIAIDDLRLIWETYLARDQFRSSPSNLSIIQAFLERSDERTPTPQDLRRVRQAVFSLQNEVLEKMEEEDFPSFVTSDLYHKAIANLPTPTSLATPLSPPTEDSSTLTPQPTTRRRSSSNPLWAKPSFSVPAPSSDSRQARTPSPIPPIPPIPLPGKGIAVQRTETLPPQVTFENPFDSPPRLRRTGSNGPKDLQTSRKASSTSLDTLQSTSSRKGAALSDSLEFLMASPTPETESRSPLFDEAVSLPEEGNGNGMTHSPNSDDDYIQVQTIEAIQDALNSILETNGRTISVPEQQSASSSPEHGRRKAKDGLRRALPPPRHPSLSTFPSTSASTSTSNIPASFTSSPVLPPPTRSVSSSSAPLPTRRKKAVFDDGELVDDLDIGEREPEFDPQSIQLAAPGDLHLPAEIVRLAASLEKLKNQESVVGALIRKAELTGNTSELKILVKSQDSLRREIRAATFQKDQYESQESENKLTPAGTRVTIPGTTVGQAEGQNFQLYLVEVHQVNADGSFRSGWIVTRRYSEFASLYAKLRDKFVPARYLEFPSKRLVTSYSKEFIEQRKIGLERYLQVSLVLTPLCRHRTRELTRTALSVSRRLSSRSQLFVEVKNYELSSRNKPSLFLNPILLVASRLAFRQITASSKTSIDQSLPESTMFSALRQLR